MITVDAVATAAMVRFGSDAELDVTENRESKEREREIVRIRKKNSIKNK